MSAALLHFSEDPMIGVFAPRESRLGFDCVWAIDEFHAPLYWFPRDCPRAAFWPTATTTPADRAWYESQTHAKMVLVMESGWLAKLRACELFVYRFDPEPFAFLENDSPGTYLSKSAVEPLGPPERVGDLLTRHAESGVELRLAPDLWTLHDTLTRTTLHWSFLRMRNAQPRYQTLPVEAIV